MSDAPLELDLKFLPDWVKETPAANRYADYQGETDSRGPRSRDDRGGPRGPGGPRPERRGPPPPRRDGDRRGPGGPGQGPGARGDRPQGDRPRGPRPGGDRPREGGRPGGPGGRNFGQRDEARPPREAPRPAPAQLKIDFLPEPNAATGIARQIKASGRAYPVFGTSKLFLERPERHRVRITSSDAAVPLFQVGDGPVSFDRAAVERNAFFDAKTEFYTEETVQGDPIKGNFSNVARARATGAFLGPTNYHGYQPALRKLYEERFSRRMSFPEFQQHEIVVVSDEAAVAEWKEQARTSTTFTTTKEAEPITFKTSFDAEQHFRKTYLPTIVKSAQTLECTGQASRSAGDRFVAGAVRSAWETESHFPQQIVNGLRPYFMEAGLHFFKHRKRVLYVSSTKPVRHPAGQIFSDGITAILKTVEASPRLKRPELAAKILGDQHDAPEAAARKEQLASDLHYLIHSGHVIEFSTGILELPLAPQEKPPVARGGKPAPSESAAEAADESSVMEAGEAEPEALAEAPTEPSPATASESTIEAEATEPVETAEEAVSQDGSPALPDEPAEEAAQPMPHFATEVLATESAFPETLAADPIPESASTVQSPAAVPAVEEPSSSDTKH
ncbi:MAG: hypothetical protein ABJF10_12635 [Chthoniobacter sp.]|uniref:hypothetical protein n=1 Tax=Chthoniobacter sp. TaxID=2510640 RepID=UPI0032A5AF70